VFTKDELAHLLGGTLKNPDISLPIVVRALGDIVAAMSDIILSRAGVVALHEIEGSDKRTEQALAYSLISISVDAYSVIREDDLLEGINPPEACFGKIVLINRPATSLRHRVAEAEVSDEGCFPKEDLLFAESGVFLCSGGSGMVLDYDMAVGHIAGFLAGKFEELNL